MQQLQGQLQILTGSSHPPGTNTYDPPVFPYTTQWSEGATSITSLTGSKPSILGRPWIIYGWSVQGQGTLQATAGQQSNGRLGKVLAALIIGGSITPTQPVQTAFSPPPADAQPNLIELWDGEQDPPFPWSTGNNTPPLGGYLGTVQQLAQPQPMDPADQLAIGLWLTPSEVANTGIFLYGFTYTVTYDTRRQ